MRSYTEAAPPAQASQELAVFLASRLIHSTDSKRALAFSHHLYPMCWTTSEHHGVSIIQSILPMGLKYNNYNNQYLLGVTTCQNLKDQSGGSMAEAITRDQGPPSFPGLQELHHQEIYKVPKSTDIFLMSTVAVRD